MTWIATNWRKSFLAANWALAGLVIIFAVIHIYATPLNGMIGLTRFLLLVSAGVLAYSAFKPSFFENMFKVSMAANPVLQKIEELKNLVNIDPDRLHRFVELARANKIIFTTDWKAQGLESPMQRVIGLENPQLALALLEAGANPFERLFGGRAIPLEVCIVRGNVKLAEAMAQRMSKFPEKDLERNLVSRAMLAICMNDMEALKNCPKSDLEKKDSLGWQPVHHAAMLSHRSPMLKYLIESGVSLNESVVYPDDKKQSKLVLAQLATLRAVDTKDETDMLTILGSGRAKISFNDSYPDAIMASMGLGLLKTVKSVEGSYNWSTIWNARTALDAAKESKNMAMVELVTRNMQAAGLIQSSGGASPSAASSNAKAANASPASTMIANRALEQSEIETKIAMSLDGLVDMDSFAHDLAVQLADFHNQKPKQSRGIVIWGDASVGKSSIGKRLSGLFDAQGIPGLEIPELPVQYHSLADTTKSLPEIIENVSAGSIVFFDEIDKFFDPGTGMVTDQEATRIKSQIVTNWDRKPIFWIFAGSFLKLRGRSDLTGKMLLTLLGSELNSRVEVAGWKLSSWTQEKIFAAARHHIDESFGNFFDDVSVEIICTKALEADGGFREFEKHARALVRLAQKQNPKEPKVDGEMTKQYYAKLDGGS